MNYVKSFDYYNSLTLLPGYTTPGRENEQNVAKAEYTTNFSSNPIGSKVDFYNHLNDPCLSLYAPNPVFNLPLPLSALDPQTFNGWWDNAMFYSHPEVTAQLSADTPSVYQNYSDSVGYLSYAPSENDPTALTFGCDATSTAITPKIPNRLLGVINGLNSSVLTKFNQFTPAGLGATKNTFLQQVGAFKRVSSSIQNSIAGQAGILKNKLPFSTNLTGNLVTPANWSHTYNIEGISSTVNKLGSVVQAPGRMLSTALVKIQNIVPKITIPSVSKLVGAYAPNMPAVSNIIGNIQSAATPLKAALSTAQSTFAAGQAAANALASSASTLTGGLNIVNTAASIQNINQVVTQNGVMAALTKQSATSLTSLSNNTVVIAGGNPNNQGVTPVMSLNTFGKP